MKIKYLNDADNGSKVEMIAYVFDSEGFYSGVSRRQPDPLNPGQFLMPGNSVSVKPILKEGFRPRWNGQAWDLVAKNKSDDIVAVEKELIEQEKAQKVFDHTVKNCIDVVMPQILEQVSLLVDSRLGSFSDRFLMMQDDLFNHVKSVCENARERTMAENREEFDRVGVMLQKLANAVIDKQSHLHSETEKLRNESLFFLAEIKSEVLKPTFWSRIKGLFVSDIPVEVGGALPAPGEETPDKIN